MTTLDADVGVNTDTSTTETTAAQTVGHAGEFDAVITEQQVMFASAPALAPAPARQRSIAVGLAAAVLAMFSRPEKPRVRKQYPQRFSYLQSAAMSRAMDRL